MNDLGLITLPDIMELVRFLQCDPIKGPVLIQYLYAEDIAEEIEWERRWQEEVNKMQLVLMAAPVDEKTAQHQERCRQRLKELSEEYQRRKAA